MRSSSRTITFHVSDAWNVATLFADIHLTLDTGKSVGGIAFNVPHAILELFITLSLCQPSFFELKASRIQWNNSHRVAWECWPALPPLPVKGCQRVEAGEVLSQFQTAPIAIRDAFEVLED